MYYKIQNNFENATINTYINTNKNTKLNIKCLQNVIFPIVTVSFDKVELIL